MTTNNDVYSKPPSRSSGKTDKSKKSDVDENPRSDKKPRILQEFEPPVSRNSSSPATITDPQALKAVHSKWNSQDDNCLREAAQTGKDFTEMANSCKFSRKFTLAELEARWRGLLYDAELAVAAGGRMHAVIAANSKRIPWTDEEDLVLKREVRSTGFRSFQQVLDANRELFHPSRTAKSLEAHYYRLRRNATSPSELAKRSERPALPMHHHDMADDLQDDAACRDADADDDEHDDDPHGAPHAMRHHEIEHHHNRGDAVFRMPAAVVLEPDAHTIAMLKGDTWRYAMRKTELIIGRNTQDNVVDLDLSQYGHADKVSRRQAVLKLLPNGSFSLKNVGKKAIQVQGVVIESGGKAILDQSDLVVEITSFRFVFEINTNLVNTIISKL